MLILLALLFVQPAIAQDNPLGVLPITETWKLPESLPTERLEKLLQQFTKQIYGKGFRYLGEEGDFFHGHVLFEWREAGGELSFEPRAILYHTQEEAYRAHWESHDKKYDYLEVTARNWLQWLESYEPKDGLVIENARDYLAGSNVDLKPFFAEGAAPVEGQYYTVQPRDLDDRKLGFRRYGDKQFNFVKIDCLAKPRSSAHRGPIHVLLPNQARTEVCLELSTI